MELRTNFYKKRFNSNNFRFNKKDFKSKKEWLFKVCMKEIITFHRSKESINQRLIMEVSNNSTAQIKLYQMITIRSEEKI